MYYISYTYIRIRFGKLNRMLSCAVEAILKCGQYRFMGLGGGNTDGTGCNAKTPRFACA